MPYSMKVMLQDDQYLFRRLRSIFTVTILICFLSSAVVAQIKSPVIRNVSTEVKVLDGKSYFLHEVLRGQTLYSIAKTYKVDLNEVIKENPGAGKVIMTGQILKIPSVKNKIAAKEKTKPIRVTATLKDEYVFYRVKHGNTLYSLAKTYDTTIDAIIGANPNLSRGLKANKTIKIPVKQALKKPVEVVTPVPSTDYLVGKIKPSAERDFTLVAKRYAIREGLYLRKEAYDAFIKMHNVAGKDGIELLIVSATRTFDQQKLIWEEKWNGQREVEGENLSEMDLSDLEKAKMILRFSSMPGSSKHHWGTDIDINSVEEEYFETDDGKKVYAWLADNAQKFDFYQPYTKLNTNGNGYWEEKWHWSYKPLAEKFLEEYLKHVTYKNLSGFRGAELARQLNVIENYVKGVAF